MQPANLLSSLVLQPEVSQRPPSASPDSLPTFPRWKRSLDVACSLSALPILGCTTLIAAVVTSVTSPGPLLFRESVQGENGRCFGMYRFRTLQTIPAGAPAKQQQTPLYLIGGRALRRTGLVKLPQIINVLRGEMTIVGNQPTSGSRSGASTTGRAWAEVNRPGILRVEAVGGEPAGSAPGARYTPSFRTELRIIARSVARAISGVLLGRGEAVQPGVLVQ